MADSHLEHERDAVQSKTGDAREAAKQKAQQAYDKLERGYAHAEVRVKEAAEDYPLVFGAGFFGLGLLAGLLLPRSEAKDELFGESSDQIKDAVTNKSEKLLERGKAVAGRVVDEAADEAERQGITVENTANALESVGEKFGSVVDASKEEGKKTARDENLTTDDLKSEVHSEAEHTKNRTSDPANID